MLQSLSPAIHSSEASKVWIWRPARGVFVTRVVGYLDVQGARAMARAFRDQVEDEDDHAGFHDWQKMTGRARGARAILTETAEELRPRIRVAHFLVRSGMDAVGVRAANLVFRRFVVHSTREAFAAALAEEILRARSV